MTAQLPDLIFLTVLGLAFGSFLNVCIHRLPLGLSLASPPSRCPACGYQLRWYDNIPVVSYAILGGRCRGCRAAISIQYPIVEVLTAVLFALHGWTFGMHAVLVPKLLFACAMVVLFAIDLEHQILPNAITLPGVVIGLLFSVLLPPPDLVSALIGAAVGGGVLFVIGEAWYRLRNIEAMGFGDVKMLAMVGAFLGWKLVVLTFVLSSFLGGIAGVVLIASRRGGLASKVPFGTFLAAAALVASLWGDRVIDWYLGLYL